MRLGCLGSKNIFRIVWSKTFASFKANFFASFKANFFASFEANFLHLLKQTFSHLLEQIEKDQLSSIYHDKNVLKNIFSNSFASFFPFFHSFISHMCAQKRHVYVCDCLNKFHINLFMNIYKFVTNEACGLIYYILYLFSVQQKKKKKN